MRHSVMVAIALSLLSCFAYSADDPVTTIYVYTWEEYFDLDEVARFEEKYNVKVDFEHYDSNETMVEKLKYSGGYDVITPPGFAINVLAEAGSMLRLDHSLLPNIRNIDAKTTSLMQDKEMVYSVPYTVTLTGVGYNADQVPEELLGSWNLFAADSFAGRFTLLNDMRETLGAALKSKGYSLNSSDPAELHEAGEVLRTWRRNVDLFSVDEARNRFRDGKYAAIQAYSGDVAQVADASPNIRFFIPREGTALDSDKFAICADSENPLLAHAFINHFLDAEVAAKNMSTIKFHMPNAAALAKMAEDGEVDPFLDIPPELREKSEVVQYLSPEATELWQNVWDAVILGE